MKHLLVGRHLLSRLLPSLLAALLWQPLAARALTEETYDVLQIGTHTYHNVTITTKAKTYVFFLHAAGMASAKVADLSPEVREKLGYVEEKPKPKASAVLAQQTMATVAKMETPQMKALADQLKQSFQQYEPAIRSLLANQRFVVLGAALVLFLLHSAGCRAICRNAGTKPGFAIWLPLFQLFPLLQAAKMSPLWFLGLLIPGLNLVALIIFVPIWCFKISHACGKTTLVAILLMIPGPSLFAFLYLALSTPPRPKKKTQRVVEIMTLEAA